MNVYALRTMVKYTHNRLSRCLPSALLVLLVSHVCLAESQPYNDPPAWVHDKVLYEVNLRQFSPEGTVAGFAEHLPRLKAMGVDILWFMPIHPIGEEARSGTLGSPYAVKDFTAFNPEFGTLEEFKQLVDRAHELGMYVIIDWVANHTSPDHPWVNQHPDWFTRDEQGNTVPPIELWADVVDLNFDAQGLRAEMIEAMAFWVREVGIDGFRCDTAEWVPLDFWVDARDALFQIKPVFMLAEGAKPELMDYAFDAAYAWDLTPNMEMINKGEKTVADLINYIRAEERIVPGNGFRVNFTTNHDINSWEGTTAERLGDGIEAFTVLTYTLAGMPLIYSGQEAGLDKRLEFFERDTIEWRDHPMAKLYQSLAQLKTEHRALWHGDDGDDVQILEDATAGSVLTFQRQAGDDRVLVMLNLGPNASQLTLPPQAEGLAPVIIHGCEVSDRGACVLKPWGYAVWSTPTASR